jgi:hypothetical protein
VLHSLSEINCLHCQTGARAYFDPQRLIGALSNPKHPDWRETSKSTTKPKLVSGRQLRAARVLAGLTQSRLSIEAGFNHIEFWTGWKSRWRIMAATTTGGSRSRSTISSNTEYTGTPLREVCALGFVEITERGRAGNAEWRRPNLFRLTYRRVGNRQAGQADRRLEEHQNQEGRQYGSKAG